MTKNRKRQRAGYSKLRLTVTHFRASLVSFIARRASDAARLVKADGHSTISKTAWAFTSLAASEQMLTSVRF